MLISKILSCSQRDSPNVPVNNDVIVARTSSPGSAGKYSPWNEDTLGIMAASTGEAEHTPHQPAEPPTLQLGRTTSRPGAGFLSRRKSSKGRTSIIASPSNEAKEEVLVGNGRYEETLAPPLPANASAHAAAAAKSHPGHHRGLSFGSRSLGGPGAGAGSTTTTTGRDKALPPPPGPVMPDFNQQFSDMNLGGQGSGAHALVPGEQGSTSSHSDSGSGGRTGAGGVQRKTSLMKKLRARLG